MPVHTEQLIRPPSFSFASFGRHVARLVQFRDLLYTLTLHRISIRYKQSVLGYYWATLHPVLLMMIYTFIFSRLVRVPTHGAPYTVFAFSALLPWTLFSNGLSTAAAGLVSHSHLLLRVYFPREIIPLAYVLAAFADFVLASLVLMGLVLYWKVSVTAHVLWIIPAIVILMILVAGLALLASAVEVRFRDVGVAMPLLLQLWMFATPVVYSLSSVPTSLRFWYDLNPMVAIVETFRGAIIYGSSPDPALLFRSFAISVTIAVAAYMWFKHVETTFADII